jgi:hypothetical protein
LGLGAEGGLGEGGATDVAEADEEDGGHGGAIEAADAG